jgi:sugar porter (SP) family MFS transporter
MKAIKTKEAERIAQVPVDVPPAIRQVTACVFGALGGLLLGYDLGVVAGALLLITKQFQLSALEQGFVTSSLLVGCMVGALGSARLADALGRRRLIVVAGVLFGIGCLIAALAGSLAVIIAGRFVMGLAVGALSMTVPIYLAEIAPARVRGALSGLNQLMISGGILVAYLINLGFDGTGQWRYSFGLALVPAVVLVVGVYFQPESPRWLTSRGRTDEARAVLARVVAPSEVDGELAQIRAVLDRPARPNVSALLADKGLRRVLLIGVGVAFLQQMIGVNTIIYYAPTILTGLGLADSAALIANAGLGALTVVVTVVMILVVDKIGRRLPLIYGAIAMAVAMAMLGTVFSVAGLKGASVAGWLAIVCLALFKVSFSMSWGGVTGILLGEIFPLKVRGTAMSLAAFANWTGNLFVGLFFPVLVGIGTGFVFYLFAVVGVISCLFALRFVPETRGKSLEAIEQQLAPTEGSGA